ncbi:nucleosidase [Kitasatospora herbaricolor]|uniref:nucleosidase n=1 Tax=Kitasatospora herbaricolor TaxID=68217 RepID=UPI001747F53C|nr:nucleosidase [Kitasatospora herbaricolor]MDQ0310984.1 adenosylhomocysteine nucleosidase [Kitasatospora herbaricolor]GGV31965.1 nucleosidase [Kitasatospora herbaricolor]
MRLLGTISPDRPLIVVAVQEEAAYLGERLPVLLTGIGKINAAAALATVLARGERPSEIVNLGTAGALRPGWEGTHEVVEVLQHDIDTPVLRELTGRTYGAAITLGDGKGPTLATGDLFVSDPAARDRLALSADLVDMEGYALATVARQAGVPVRLVKHVSDEAGEGAARSWRESVDACARELADWARDQGL